MGKKQRKVLVIRNSALGDVAMTLPVVYSAARQHPEVEFLFLTRPFFARIFLNAPSNLTILTADFKGEYSGAKGVFKLLRKLSSLGLTDVADLHNVLRSWIIDGWMILSGKRVRMVTKHRLGRISGDSRRRQRESFFDRYADVFGRLGLPVNVDFVSLFDEQKREAPTEPIVGIAPFARYFNKAYPIEMMEEVVSRLNSDGIRTKLFGSRGAEAEQLARLCEKYPNCELIAGKHSIEEELEIMSGLSVMVTMDSANHHLASLAGVPVVSIWGSTTPACGFMGYRQSPSDAICLDLPCQPCTTAGSPECKLKHFNCMRQIAPQTIYNRIKKHIQ